MAEAAPEPRLPRRLASGITWMGDCLPSPYEGGVLHSYDSLFLIEGDDASLLVEAGLPVDADAIDVQLSEATADAPPVRYVFLTHQETPHAGGLARILARFPDAEVVGDVRDYHLIFPQHAQRLRPLGIGDELDLGGVRARVLAPVIKDLPTTQWLFVPERRALFTGDGFAFAHHHRAGECGRLVSELPDLDVAGLGSIFIEFALHWLRFVEPQPFIDELQRLVEELDVALVGPTHGLPATDVQTLMPAIRQGLRGSRHAAEA